jgi:hypothetical protein
MTAFNTPEFITTELTNIRGETIKCWIRAESGKFNPDFLRNESQGFLTGFMIEPTIKPSWLIPGCILTGEVLGLPTTLTLEPSYKSPIVEVDQELGEKIKFSYVINSEFSDGF